MRGRVAEGSAWLDVALDAPLDTPSVLPLRVKAKALADRAVLGLWMDGADAGMQAKEALAIARELDDPALLARVLTACGSAFAYDYESARPYFTEATAIASAIGDNWRLCQIFSRQTNGAFSSGALMDAEAVAQEGMELADELGDQFGSAQCRIGR